MGKIKIQCLFLLFSVTINLPLAFLLGSILGMAGVVLAGVIGLLFSVIPLSLTCVNYFKEKNI